MNILGIFASIIIGGVSGWLAGKLMNSKFSTLGNIIIGIVGGFVGGILLGLVGLHGSGLIGRIIVSVVGACALIALGRAIKK